MATITTTMVTTDNNEYRQKQRQRYYHEHQYGLHGIWTFVVVVFFVLETHQGECKASNKSPRFSKPVVDLKQKTRRGESEKERERERKRVFYVIMGRVLFLITIKSSQTLILHLCL